MTEITNIEHEPVEKEPELKVELNKIISISKIEPTKGENLKASFNSFIDKMIEIEKKISAINKTDPSPTDIKIARSVRLALRDNRTDAEKKKKELKESILIEGRLIDNAFGLVENTSKGLELQLSNIEKAAEIKEQQRRDALDAERKLLLAPYEQDLTGYDLGVMKQETFDQLLDNMKAGHEKRLEEKRREEEERINREANERLHKEREIQLRPYFPILHKDFNTENLYSHSEEEWEDIIFFYENKQAEIEAEQQRIREENERLKKEAEENEAKLKQEREEAQRKQAEQDRLQQQRFSSLKPYIAYCGDINMQALYVFADQEFEDILLEVRALFNKDEQERKDKELKAKQEQEEKEKRLADERRIAAEKQAEADRIIQQQKERAAKEAAEKKAAELAPDKEKLFTLASSIESFALPAVVSEDAVKIVDDVQKLLGKVSAFIRGKIETL